MRKSSYEANDGTQEDEDEVEQRRREYLRRHREMLLQKQRLETVTPVVWSVVTHTFL